MNNNIGNLPFHLPARIATKELAAHLSDAASADVVEWDRLCLVANDLGFDMDVDLMLIKAGPTPRANLRRFALSL